MAPTYGPWSTRDIVPKKAKPPAKKPAAPGGGGGAHALTPAQQVAAALKAQLTPLDYTEHARQTRAAEDAQQRQNATIAIMRELNSQQAPTAALFDQALQQQQGYASQYAGMLKDANPNADIQASLAAIGAPQAQRDQIAGQNTANYGGQAGFLFGQQGVIPGNTLLSNRNAQVGFLAGLPAIEGLAGLQAQSAAGRVSAGQHDQYVADRLRITGQAPGLLQQANAYEENRQAAKDAAIQKQINANTQLDLERKSLGIKIEPRPNASLSKAFGYIVDQYGNPLTDRAGRTVPYHTTPKTPKTPAKDPALRPNPALSKGRKYMVDGYGNPVTDATGNPIPTPKNPAKPPKAGTAGKQRQAFFYGQRAKAIKDARGLFAGPTADPGAPPLTVAGPSSGPTPASPKNPAPKAYTPYNKAYNQLYTSYQPALSAQGFKRAAIRQMIENSLKAAGYKIPPRRTPKPRGPQ